MLGFHNFFFLVSFRFVSSAREIRFFLIVFIWHWLGLVGEREFDRLSSSICKNNTVVICYGLWPFFSP